MNSENFFAPIAALDLDPIKLKLMHQESGEGWSRAYADAVESEYRRFLYLVKKFPHDQVARFFDVDVFWLSIRTDKVAFSSPSGKTAFSSPSGPVASSFPAAQFPFCSPMTESGTPGEAVEIAGFDTSGGATAAPFYSVRPTISRAA